MGTLPIRKKHNDNRRQSLNSQIQAGSPIQARQTDGRLMPSICLSVVCLSHVVLSVCNVVAPYSDGWTFRQYFCTLFIAWGVGTRSLCILNFDKKTIWYVMVQVKWNRVWKIGVFLPISRFISRTVQDTVQLIKDEWEIVCDLYGAISNDLQWPLTYNFKVTILINVK